MQMLASVRWREEVCAPKLVVQTEMVVRVRIRVWILERGYNGISRALFLLAFAFGWTVLLPKLFQIICRVLQHREKPQPKPGSFRFPLLVIFVGFIFLHASPILRIADKLPPGQIHSLQLFCSRSFPDSVSTLQTHRIDKSAPKSQHVNIKLHIGYSFFRHAKVQQLAPVLSVMKLERRRLPVIQGTRHPRRKAMFSLQILACPKQIEARLFAYRYPRCRYKHVSLLVLVIRYDGVDLRIRKT
ncbi:hypothetical protein K458DRAFT_56123 [Lentithecium fluviatile CBS 122367]|uniref:Uncharacterized protein n=1 Tax=Lentithecium fluviatile CBS 122367 TaxID=1168545 RepID=A0A6G1IY59_9PLEO|nr:hypothetical protein K458DRAFT_56123 [Lentithecium fluviatile CBS 122367]